MDRHYTEYVLCSAASGRRRNTPGVTDSSAYLYHHQHSLRACILLCIGPQLTVPITSRARLSGGRHTVGVWQLMVGWPGRPGHSVGGICSSVCIKTKCKLYVCVCVCVVTTRSEFCLRSLLLLIAITGWVTHALMCGCSCGRLCANLTQHSCKTWACS